MRLINCKVELSLSWDPNYVLSNLVQASIFTITDAKLYVPIVLKDKAFKIASDPKYDGYQTRLASMVYNFFDKTPSGSGAANEKNHQLSDELHKQITKEFNRRTLYSLLADMQSLSKCNKGIKYLLCVVDLFSKYAWVVPLKGKRRISIVNVFPEIISEGRKRNKIWVDQGG